MLVTLASRLFWNAPKFWNALRKFPAALRTECESPVLLGALRDLHRSAGPSSLPLEVGPEESVVLIALVLSALIKAS